jgi:hypothetical protein
MGMLGTFFNWMKKKNTGDGPDLGPVLNQYKFKNPDHLWKTPGTITFFYVPDTKKLFTDRGDITHAQMIKNPKIGPQILPDLWDQNHPSPRIEAVKRGIFAGRLIPNKVVSLWNNDKSVLDMHLKDMLAALQQQGHVNDQTVVTSPVYYPFFAGGNQATAPETRPAAETPWSPADLHTKPGGFGAQIRLARLSPEERAKQIATLSQAQQYQQKMRGLGYPYYGKYGESKNEL